MVVLTNVLQNRSTFFHIEPIAPPQKECQRGRCYPKRFSHIHSDGLVRDLERTTNSMYMDDQIRPHEMPRAHDTCRGLAAVKWGPMKLG